MGCLRGGHVEEYGISFLFAETMISLVQIGYTLLSNDNLYRREGSVWMLQEVLQIEK